MIAPRIPAYLILLSLVAHAALAQQQVAADALAAAEAKSRLQHKIRMVEFILTGPGMQQRLANSDDQVAAELIGRARANFTETSEYFAREQYLEAEAILDYVLRDLSAASQLLSAESRVQSSYDQALRQLDAFELPEWQQLSAAQNQLLEERSAEIAELRARAVRSAQQGDHRAALGLVDRAYQLNSALLAELPHRQVVVYDLDFDSPREEYDYLSRRADHYFELIEIALGRAVIGMQARKLVDDYIYRAVADFDAAQGLAQRDRHADANLRLDETIRQLVAVLKILGITI